MRAVVLKRQWGEGIVAVALGAVGGAGLMLLWLKVGSLVGVRDVGRAQYHFSYLVATTVWGAIAGVVAQALWAWAGERVVHVTGGSGWAGDLKSLWGRSALPQVLAVFVLLPVDMAVLGGGAFTTEPAEGSWQDVWSALSVALYLSLAVWSLARFVAGLRATGGTTATALLGTATAAGCFLVTAGALAAVGIAAVKVGA